MNKDNDFLNILRNIQNNPKTSQRSLAKRIGLSLGKLNYCLNALKQKGLVKAKNFKTTKTKKIIYIFSLQKAFLQKQNLQ